MQAALLSDRGILKVFGADARRFLHGLLTANIETMMEGTPRYAALLTPQGKIVADVLVLQRNEPDGEAFLLDCERKLASALIAKLNFYKLRAKATVEDVSDKTAVLALWDHAPAASTREPSPPWFVDPRLDALGWRAMVAPGLAAGAAHAQGAQIGDEAAYEAHRIALAVPRGGVDFAYGDAFPHEADMDQLRGVDFAKGCYVGQEVVSRMQHRASARSRVVPVGIAGAAPEPGAPVLAGEKTVGVMGSAAAARGLALLRLDRVADATAAGLPLIAGEATLRVVEPAWGQLGLAGAAKAVE